jgi:glycosyltransferase involved in cell wall biosynthesis
MAARGHAVTLFVWNAEGPNAELCSPDVRLVSLDLPMRGGGFGKIGTLRGLARSVAFLCGQRPDAVFSGPDFANLVMTVAVIAGTSRSTSFFPSYHAPAALRDNALGSRIAPALTILVARRTTKAIAVSSGVGRDLVARGFRQEQVAVIYNPLPSINARASNPHPWAAALAEAGKGPVIVTLGRLVPIKDHRTLLDAFSLLDPARGYRLVIFGEGPQKASLVSHARTLGIAGRVLFPGYINDPAACYACADLFVLSSLNEGFGNVLIEAMAAGVPVVSTDAPYGPREILADGQFGTLVPVGDAAALAQAIQDTLAQPPRAEDLRQRAGNFSIKIIGDHYESLIGPCPSSLKPPKV